MPISLSIGVLAGLWTYISIVFGILTWPAFIGWALFFLGGGNKESITKNIPPMLSGVIFGYLCVLVNNTFSGGTVLLAVLVAVIAFIMTFMMNIPAFATAPAAFAACATFFGVGDPLKAAIPLLIGLFLGYISVILPEGFKTKSNKAQST